MENSSTATTVTVDPRLVSWTHWMYALHALAIVIGVVTSASIVGKFIFGLPSIIAVIMNYLRRNEAQGTWLEPHFSWQLRTFWFAALACIVSLLVFGPLVLLLIGIPLVAACLAGDRHLDDLSHRPRLAGPQGWPDIAGQRRLKAAMASRFRLLGVLVGAFVGTVLAGCGQTGALVSSRRRTRSGEPSRESSTRLPPWIPRDPDADRKRRRTAPAGDSIIHARVLQMSEAPLILIDGSSYLYRAFHALPPLTNSRGEPTGAVLGVLNMLRRFLQEHPGCPMVVVFDAPGKTFRDDLFAEYKANRPSMPDDLRSQIEPLLAAVTAMGLPLLRIPGVEADDVIGTLARRAAGEGRTVLISTGDKDMCQLVDERITLINTMTNTDAGSRGREGEVRCLAGTDHRLPRPDRRQLRQHPGHRKGGTEDRGEVAGHLRNHRQAAGACGGDLRRGGREPAQGTGNAGTVATPGHHPPRPGPAGVARRIRRGPVDTAALRALYERLEFKALLRGAGWRCTGDRRQPMRHAAAAGAAPAVCLPAHAATARATCHRSVPRNYTTIVTQEQLDEWLPRLMAAELVAFDTETTSLDYREARVVGLSFCIKAGEAAYVPLAHCYAGAPEQLGTGALPRAAQAVARERRMRARSATT